MQARRGRRRPLSLAARITAIVVVAMSAVFGVFSALIAHSIALHFEEQDLSEIDAVATSLQSAIARVHETFEPLARRNLLAGAVAGHHGVYFDVRDATGLRIFSTAPRELATAVEGAPASMRLGADTLRIWSVGKHVYRGALLRIGTDTALVAVSIDAHLRYLEQLRRTLLWVTLAAAVAAIPAVWAAVRWGHAPLRRIGATVRGITSEQLHVRLEPAGVPAELEPLVVSFNGMLDQLQASFTRLSNFSADIAHELRTPVTNLTTQTQVALSRPRSVDAYREVLYSALEELERMGKMVGDMLLLAKAEHPLHSPDLTEVDLAAETRALFDYFEALAEDRGVSLRLEGHAPGVRGDRPMLRRALANLISNALRHTSRGEATTVSLASAGDSVEVQVSNPGPDIAAQHLPHLFDRFYRVDPSRQHNGEGTGLGLAIVRSIVEAHEGSVAVISSGGLTRFVLRLPGASRPSA